MKVVKFVVAGGLLMIGVVVLYSTTYRQSPSFTIKADGQQTQQQLRTQTAETPTPGNQPETELAQEKSRIQVQRDAYLSESINALNDQIKALVCARKRYYTNSAEEFNRQTGADIERWYLDKLAMQVAAIAKEQRAFTGYTGDPSQQAIARPMTVDNLALTLALQDLYQGKQGKDCTVNFSIALEQVGKYQVSANTFKAYQAAYQEKIRLQNGVKPGDDNANSGTEAKP